MAETTPGGLAGEEAVDPATLPARIHLLVAEQAAARPQACAFVDHDGRRFSWSQTEAAVDAATQRLQSAGVGPGDRVMVVQENCVAAVAVLMAASRLDAWAVPLNARLAAPEIAAIRNHCAPRAIVFTTGVSAHAGAHASTSGAGEADDPAYGSLAIVGQLPGEPSAVEADGRRQVAALLYTSGTTGQPKGVMLTHANLLYIALVSGRIRALAATDRVYGVLPVSHIFGLASTMLGSIAAGARFELVPRFDPSHLATALASGITVLQGVPPMFAQLLDHLDGLGEPLAAPALRYLSSGGAPLDIDWKRRMEARFGVALNNGYGLTENAPTVAQTRIDRKRDDDSVGWPLPGVAVRVVGPNGEDIRGGEVGELWVRGPTVMAGYYRDPAASAAVLTGEGWLRTGDLGRRDPDGALFLVGRSKELIIRSGFNVYPPDVEAALNAHPDVVQAAVVGRAVKGNEEILAFVELTPGSQLTRAALADFAATRLAAYKRPQHLFVLDRIPATSTGKLRKHVLAALADGLIETDGGWTRT
ncbi:MAG: class I adenylate-forming enzyme family protein [Alsobacter sp.]